MKRTWHNFLKIPMSGALLFLSACSMPEGGVAIEEVCRAWADSIYQADLANDRIEALEGEDRARAMHKAACGVKP